ncbi:MAG: cobalamin biosynthesis protein CbiA [FCB group bacterium]|nr:cobalamin biosynthesis protein CbiA [FCB group bacterium]
MIRFQSPVFSKDIIIIVGSYGSGKSEVAVNLARFFVSHFPPSEKPVAIADLDVVNPYFRSREAASVLEELGIRAINPKGGQFYADIPIILPEIKGAIEHNEGILILDAGGDDVGAKVLSSLNNAFIPDTYELLLVLNANRPFTSDMEGCLKMIKNIETASRLKVTGIISNTHLMENTTPEIIIKGLKLSKAVSKKTKLPLSFLSATTQDLKKIALNAIDIPVLPLNRLLLKPWEKKD